MKTVETLLSNPHYIWVDETRVQLSKAMFKWISQSFDEPFALPNGYTLEQAICTAVAYEASRGFTMRYDQLVSELRMLHKRNVPPSQLTLELVDD